jgi:hypothetical protein
MGSFAALVGWIAGRPRARGVAAQRALLLASSALAVLVGGFWLFASLQATVAHPDAALAEGAAEGR